MKTHIWIASAAAFVFTLGTSAATTVLAAEAAGVLQHISGEISVSGSNGVARAIDGMSVNNGDAILTSSSGTGLLELNNGCVLELDPGQFTIVNNDAPCDAIVAASPGSAIPPLLVAGTFGGALLAVTQFSGSVSSSSASASNNPQPVSAQ